MMDFALELMSLNNTNVQGYIRICKALEPVANCNINQLVFELSIDSAEPIENCP